LVQEIVFLLDLDVITQKERNRELKKDEKINEYFKSLFLHPQASDPKGHMAENKNIKIIFVHDKFLTALLWKLPAHRAGLPGNEVSFLIVPLDPASRAGLTGHLPVKME
jgi:hypothetical protein